MTYLPTDFLTYLRNINAGRDLAIERRADWMEMADICVRRGLMSRSRLTKLGMEVVAGSRRVDGHGRVFA